MGDAVEGLRTDYDGEFDPGHEFNSLVRSNSCSLFTGGEYLQSLLG